MAEQEHDGGTPSVRAQEVPENYAAWAVALKRLETDLAAVVNDRALGAGNRPPAAADPPAAWDPPTGMGPIPPELVERARRLAQAQQEAIAALQTAVLAARRQAEYVGSVPTAARTGGAVYLDVAG